LELVTRIGKTFLPKPEWLKVRAPGGPRYAALKERVRRLDLHTVCEEARCPNIGECWGQGTATMMLLGDVCTRGCRFCAVESGRAGRPLDPNEPAHVAHAVREMELRYVVLTSVDRDDLPDQGAAHYAACVRAIKAASPEVLVEVLTPDWQGDDACARALAESGADVLAHNVEVVPRLQRSMRDARCSYDVSLATLRAYKRHAPERHTKSSIMVGCGETEAEVLEVLRDLRGAGVSVVTVGQYLRPTPKHAEVARFAHPDEFAAYERAAREMGFLFCASGPLVRSSYRAGELFMRALLEGQRADPSSRSDSTHA
jgi:lipoic acid synthetase